jgi:hypothetical protein
MTSTISIGTGVSLTYHALHLHGKPLSVVVLPNACGRRARTGACAVPTMVMGDLGSVRYLFIELRTIKNDCTNGKEEGTRAS